MHPLQAGLFRRKYRADRRPGLPRENPLAFYARYGWEIVSKHLRLAGLMLRYRYLQWRVESDPAAARYQDVALRPVAEGDAEAGNALFFGKAGCSNCHRIRGQGGVLGPDLTDIGAGRRLDQIREALLDPGNRIADGYTAVTLTLENGEKLRAVARNFNNYSAQVFDASGKLHLLRREDLKRLKFEEKSWMPGDYGTRLSEVEVQNLLAFLSRQAVREERRGEASE